MPNGDMAFFLDPWAVAWRPEVMGPNLTCVIARLIPKITADAAMV